MATSCKFHYRKQVFARRRNIARVVSKGFNIKKNGELREFWSCTFQITNNTGADQTVWMRRLVCPFLAIRQQSQGFLRRCPYDVEAQASWPPPGYALIVKYFPCMFLYNVSTDLKKKKWAILHIVDLYLFIKVGTRFSYCAPVFGQFRGILDTFLNTELIFLRIPRELVIIYLCKRTPYGITALVFISICSSRPFPFTARRCFQKARLDPEGVLF